MGIKNQSSIFLLVGIIVSSCTDASSFGTAPHIATPSSSVLFRHPSSPLKKHFFPIRGGAFSLDSYQEEEGQTVAETGSESTSITSSAASHMGPKAKTPPGFLRSVFPTFPWHSLPNILTYLRCLAIPALVVLFYTEPTKVANKNVCQSLLFAAASLTDWFDGFLARRWDITSAFGAFLDPVADKLMVSTALILLSGLHGATVAVPTAIILAREIAVSALREWMAQRGLRDSVKVGYQGKVKTAATMVALTILLSVPSNVPVQFLLRAGSSIWENAMSVGMGLLYLSTVLTVTSGSVYFKAAAPVLMGK